MKKINFILNHTGYTTGGHYASGIFLADPLKVTFSVKLQDETGATYATGYISVNADTMNASYTLFNDPSGRTQARARSGNKKERAAIAPELEKLLPPILAKFQKAEPEKDQARARQNLECYATGAYITAYCEVYAMKDALENTNDNRDKAYFNKRLSEAAADVGRCQKMLVLSGYADALPELRAEGIARAKSLYHI